MCRIGAGFYYYYSVSFHFFPIHSVIDLLLVRLPLPPIYILAAVVLRLEPDAKVIHAAHWYVVRATRGIGFSLLFLAILYIMISYILVIS